MKTAIYLRVSSQTQADKGTIESQRMAVEGWMDRAGVGAESVEWFVDNGQTGKVMKRPAFDEMNARIAAGEFQQVVTMELSRVGRSALGVIRWVREMQEKKVNIVCVREGIDFSTAMGRFMATMLAGLYELELETSGARRRDGIARYRREHGRWGARSTLTAAQKAKLAERLKVNHWPKGEIARVAAEIGCSYNIVAKAKSALSAKVR